MNLLKIYQSGQDPILYIFNFALEQAKEVIDDNGTTKANPETIRAYEDVIAFYSDINAFIQEAEQYQKKIGETTSILNSGIWSEETLNQIQEVIKKIVEREKKMQNAKGLLEERASLDKTLKESVKG